MKKISGLTSFEIKIIALITMIIDHIGYFFYYSLSSNIYNACRIVGRIAMPLFVFSVYQGFIHTTDLKKYLKRLMLLAVLTQLLSLGIGIFANFIAPQYNINFYKEMNIIFSFCLSLILLEIMKRYLESQKKDFKNTVMLTLFIILFVGIYLYLNIDYGLLVPVMLVGMYIYDKYMQKSKRIFKILYTIIAITIFFAIYAESLVKYSILAIIPMLFYNGKRGNGNKKIFYYGYVIQYVILYLLGIIMYM